MQDYTPKALSSAVRALLLVLVVLALAGCTSEDPEGRLLGTVTVRSGAYERTGMPIQVSLPASEVFGALEDSIPDDAGSTKEYFQTRHLVLVEQGGQEKTLPAQWDPEVGFPWKDSYDEGSLIWILEGETPPQATRTFQLRLRDGSPSSSALQVEDQESKHLLVQRDGERVLRYNYGVVRETEGETGPYDRSSYIHPVWTPSGKVITGDFSPEHIHQRGIFLAWREVQFDDAKVDFWGLGDSRGRVVPAPEPPLVLNGPVFAKLTIQNNGTVDDEVYFKENHYVRVYALANADRWLFDVKVRQVPVRPGAPRSAPDSSVRMELQKLYYGGMSYRATSKWLREDSRDVQRVKERGVTFPADFEWLAPSDSLDILTSQGKGRTEGDRTRASWIDYTGPLGDEWGGLLTVDHPSNPRHPTPLRVHPELPYFSYAMVQQEPYTINGEDLLELTYRFLVHDGHPDQELNEYVAQHFIHPPDVDWEGAN